MQNPPQTAGWQGKLDLVYRFQNGETQISHSFAQAPLKIQRPFYPEGKAICHSVILHTAGGIVGGDRLEQTLHLQPQAQALITTATAGKVYRSEGKIAQQTVTIKLEKDTFLEWLPQELIIFNNAFYRQRVRVELAPDASFLGWDILRLGRSARGERFEAGELRSQMEIWRNNVPLWIDRQQLVGNEDLLSSPNALAGKSVVATLIYIGKPLPQQLITQARDCWQNGDYQGEGGVTQTLGEGLVCRYRGTSTAEARHWFTEVWQVLREFGWQRAIVKPRVWML